VIFGSNEAVFHFERIKQETLFFETRSHHNVLNPETFSRDGEPSKTRRARPKQPTKHKKVMA
jgi:hypothetical protein